MFFKSDKNILNKFYTLLCKSYNVTRVVLTTHGFISITISQKVIPKTMTLHRNRKRP